MNAESRVNLLNFDRRSLELWFVARGDKRFRAQQILKWVYQLNVDDFELMTNLGKALRAQLAEEACIALPQVVSDQGSDDGSRKWLLKLDDGNCIETVFIPEEGRGTLCVSSQVGCALNCSFCSTAQQGFNRNLTAGEIIAQLVIAKRLLGDGDPGARPVTNVVMMGMGEPLLNFDNVVIAMNLIRDDHGFGLSKRRITLSTAGLVPDIDRLRDQCDVSLAVSLHAPDDSLRDELVPLNRKYPIAELLAACRRYVADEPRRRVTFEYVMLDGINDSDAHAKALIRLLEKIPSKVNLIPFNRFPQTRYKCSSPQRIKRFRDLLLAAGLVTITRKTRGDDIDAACGQLAGRFVDRTRRRQHTLMREGVNG